MDLSTTRTALHGIAELLLAGPQYAASGTIRLRVLPGGIATVAEPDLRLAGGELRGPAGRRSLSGTYAEAAAALGVELRPLADVYRDRAEVAPDDPIEVDPAALDVLLGALADGDAALTSFAPGERPVLWPEHLDVAVSVAEVNYGVSPGDAHLPEPYAYVGPWAPRRGTFWDRPFGAARPTAELGGPEAIAAFFHEGARAASLDPVVES